LGLSSGGKPLSLAAPSPSPVPSPLPPACPLELFLFAGVSFGVGAYFGASFSLEASFSLSTIDPGCYLIASTGTYVASLSLEAPGPALFYSGVVSVEEEPEVEFVEFVEF
jgi:hypothetical protein